MRNQLGHHQTNNHDRWARAGVRRLLGTVLALLLAGLAATVLATSAHAEQDNCVQDVCLQYVSDFVYVGQPVPLTWAGTRSSYTATTTAPDSSWHGTKPGPSGDAAPTAPGSPGTFQYCLTGDHGPACVTVAVIVPASCDSITAAISHPTVGHTDTISWVTHLNGDTDNHAHFADANHYYDQNVGPTGHLAVTQSTAGTDTYTISIVNGLRVACQKSVTITWTTASSTHPTASLALSADHGPAPLTVTADASGSTAPNDQRTPADAIASYRFTWGDGTATGTQTNATAQHTYTRPGSYQLTLTVTDTSGRTDTATRTLTVTTAGGSTTPPPTAPSSSSSGLANTGTDNQQGILIGLGLLLAGTAALALGRRRRPARHHG